jgi:hypothetical protein
MAILWQMILQFFDEFLCNFSPFTALYFHHGLFIFFPNSDIDKTTTASKPEAAG